MSEQLHFRQRVPDLEAAARLRVPHVLNTVAFEPRGMPPSATLLVRRVPDPLPRRLMSNWDAARSSPEWERAVLSSLEDFYRRAARPAHEFVPASAASVLFLDEGEMLACLALDLLNGNAAARWWWTAILRRFPHSGIEALLAAWRGKPRYVPAALHHLAQRRQAITVVEAFSPAEAWSLLAAVAREFDLRLPTSVSATDFVPVAPPETSPTQPSEEFHRVAPTSLDSIRNVLPPWSPVLVGEVVPDSLRCERAALLGVALLLQRAPQVLRSAAFVRSFACWYEAAARPRHESRPLAERDVPPRAKIAAEMSSASASADATASPQLLPDATTRETTNLPANDSVANKTPGTFEAGLPQGAIEILASPPAGPIQAALQTSPAEDFSDRLGTSVEDTAPSRNNIQSAPVENTAELETAAPKTSPTTEEELQIAQATAPQETRPIEEFSAAYVAQDGIQTELGGVLFLINLVRALGLHSFLERLGLGDQLSDWELVELLARCLIGRRSSHLATDPIWLALSELDGRGPAAPAGLDFRGRERYALPQTWVGFLANSEKRSLGLRLRPGQLQIWHEYGFLLLDTVFDANITQDMVRRELSACCEDYELMTRAALRGVLSKTRLTGCDPSIRPGRELRRFLAFLLPYVRWRLAINLGLSSAGSLALVDALLLRTARVYITSTHIDLVMSMNQASGPVRLAGLDADPGWLPSFGRVVKFHFN